MTPESPPEPEQGRKPYEKPTLSQVSLRPEEAVLGNCKTMGVAGPANSDCMTLGCMSFGS
jgi:hypothetical protein